MSFDYEDKETSRLQAAADYIDSMRLSSLDLRRRLWVLTILPHTMSLKSWSGWNPKSGVEGDFRVKRAFATGSLPIFRVVILDNTFYTQT